MIEIDVLKRIDIVGSGAVEIIECMGDKYIRISNTIEVLIFDLKDKERIINALYNLEDN